MNRLYEWFADPWNIWGDFLLIALVVVSISTLIWAVQP